MSPTGPTKHILDVGGLLLKRYHGSEDRSIEDGDAKPVSSWQAALLDFHEQHILPLLQAGSAPRDIIAAWDKGNAYRTGVWEGYKKRRREQERPEAQEKEIKKLKANAETFLAYLGVKQVWVPGEEADDLIALLCQKLSGHKMVHTVDADLLALVDSKTSVMRLGQLHLSGSCIGAAYHVPYSLISLHKALVGDSSDGYSGVKGFGPVAWDRLLADYGEAGLQWLQAIIEADLPADLRPYAEVDERMGKLYHQWSEVQRGWRLASLNPAACYGTYRNASGKTLPKRPEWRVRIPEMRRVYDILKDCLSVTSGLFDLDANLERQRGLLDRFFPTERLITVKEAGELTKLMPEILASEVVSYDFESSDKLHHMPFREASTKDFVDVISQTLAGISINWGDNLQHTVYVSFDHANTANLDRDWAAWILQTLSSRSAAKNRCVVQNASFELSVALTNLGFMPSAPYDTQIMASYVDENEESGLKAMSQRILNYRQTSYEEVTQGRLMCDMEAHEVVHYGCDDALVTSHLFDLFKLIMELEGSWDFYAKYEVDPATDDAYSFVRGTEVDYARLDELRAASAQRKEEAEQALRGLLAEHPGDEEAAYRGAMTLLTEWWTTAEYKYLDRPDEAREAYAALWEKAWAACFYSKPEVRKETKEFVPTLTMVNQVIGLIDREAPRLKSIAIKAIEKYDEVLEEHLSRRSPLSREAIDLREFYLLLRAARQWLKPSDRSGNNYDRLRDFCQSIVDEKAPGKVVSTGSALNWGSAPQMQQMLYGLMGLPVRRRSKVTEGSLRAEKGLVGSPATGLKAVAAAMVWDVSESDWRHEALSHYAAICKEQQLESLYFKKLGLWAHPVDGRIHPQFRNCGTATRRPTGSNPNFYQIAKGAMRSMFPAGEGRVFVSIDVAGQELAVCACTAKDPVLLSAFTQSPRQDVHSLTASGIAPVLLPRLGVPWSGPMTYEQFLEGLHSPDEKVKSAYKTVRNRYAKSLLFSILYGSSAVGVAENLLIAKEEAERMVDALFGLYSEIPVWQRACANYAKEHGYVLMPFGTRRHAEPDLWSDDRKLVSRQERQLSNSQIQGAAAEMLKVIRQGIFDRSMRERYQMETILEIYDECTSSVPLALAKDYILELAEVMRVQSPGFEVAMEVDASIGFTWGTQIEVGLPTPENIDKALKQLEEST